MIKDFKTKYDLIKNHRALLQKLIAEPLINNLLNSAVNITKNYKKIDPKEIKELEKEFKISETTIIETLILEDLINKIVKRYENQPERNRPN